ncbi:MAG: phage tail protein [Ruminococcus flavefaciens]|nr:phage tail protein [Ruminococcus flavefaciens]
MYKIDDIGSTFASLPPNLQTVENECLCYAVDKQIRKLKKVIDELNVWGAIERIDPKYYDALAACVQIPYYRSELNQSVKLKLLMSFQMLYRYAGTKKAVLEMLNTVFEHAEFLPWYEYGGEPYHFRIKVYDVLTGDALEILNKVLGRVKSTRSIIDSIEVARETDSRLLQGHGFTLTYRNEPIEEG